MRFMTIAIFTWQRFVFSFVTHVEQVVDAWYLIGLTFALYCYIVIGGTYSWGSYNCWKGFSQRYVKTPRVSILWFGVLVAFIIILTHIQLVIIDMGSTWVIVFLIHNYYMVIDYCMLHLRDKSCMVHLKLLWKIMVFF